MPSRKQIEELVSRLQTRTPNLYGREQLAIDDLTRALRLSADGRISDDAWDALSELQKQSILSQLAEFEQASKASAAADEPVNRDSFTYRAHASN